MNTMKVYAAPDGEELTIHQMVRHYPQWAARMVQEGDAAQQRIAELEGELDRLQTLADKFMRAMDGANSSVAQAVAASELRDKLRNLRAEMENPDAD